MIEIIPAIDLIEGKAVRLRQGDFAQKTIYRENPLEVAREFESIGVRRLHLVDLDGARTGKITNLAVLEQIASGTKLIVDFGGGVKTRADANSIFDAGAQILTIGSLAVREPEKLTEWLAEFGGERILLGADVRDNLLAINGWQTMTEIGISEFLQTWFKSGVKQAFCTDISRDGLLAGAATALYEQIHRELPEIYLIASGGVSELADFGKLEKAGCRGAIVGKAIYEGKISLAEIADYLKNAG